MNFTVAIVTYDRPRCIDRLLDSLQTQTRRPDEIIVVNNGENGHTAAVVEEHAPAFERLGSDLRHLERSDTNLPAGRNAALETATGDVICFLDDDTIASESWLEGIRRGYELDEDVVAVGGPSLAVDETLTPRFEPDRSATNRNRLNRYGEACDSTRYWIPPHPVRTDLLQGSNMSFKIPSLASIGGFDPIYGDGYPLFEDTDVMAKYWHRDDTLIYHPDALVYHERVARNDSSYHYWFARNSVRFRRRNFSERYYRSLLRMLLWRQYSPPPVWRQLASVLIHGDEQNVARIRGYIDGIVLAE